MIAITHPRDRLFYGWVVLFAAFIVRLAAFSSLYSVGTYFEPLSQEFGVSKSALALVMTISGVLSYSLGGLIGPMADKVGGRVLGLAGAVLFLVGLGLAAHATEIWHIYLGYGLLVGTAIALTSTPALGIVQRWFSRRRALAASLVAIAMSLGTFLGPPATTWLIAHHGWRHAFLVTGIAVALLACLYSWLIVDSPARRGCGPDGDPPIGGDSGTGRSSDPSPSIDLTIREAIRTPEFFGLYMSFALATVALFLGVAHFVSAARDSGFTPEVAAWGLGAMGVGGIVSRPLFGGLADHLGRRRSYALSIGLFSAVWVWWLFWPPQQTWTLLVFGFIWGVTYAGFAALGAVMPIEYFGTKSASGLVGVFYTACGCGMLFGPWLGGVLYDLTGSYRPAILLGIACTAIGFVSALLVRDAARFKANRAASSGRSIAEIGMAGDAVEPFAGRDSWDDWNGRQRERELALARLIAAWRPLHDPELDEVLEIAAAHARDRAFLLRRSAGPRSGAETVPVDPDDLREWPAASSNLVCLAWLAGRLTAYQASLPPTAEPAQRDLFDRLADSERQTRDLIEEQLCRLRVEAKRQSIQVIAGENAHLLDEGRVLWKPLCSAIDDGPGIVWVLQQPDTVVRFGEGTGLRVVLLDGEGWIRREGDAGVRLQGRRAVSVGAEVVAEVAVEGDLPLAYLVVGAGPVAPWLSPLSGGASLDCLLREPALPAGGPGLALTGAAHRL